jgi:hypothetical protein
MARTTQTAANGHANTQPQAASPPESLSFLLGRLAARGREEAKHFYDRSTWKTWAAVAAGALVLWWLAGKVFGGKPAEPAPLPATLFGTAAPAFTPAALPSSLTFVCRSAANVKGRVLLNDSPNYKDAAVTVVGEGPEFAGADAAKFKGRGISVTGGVPSSYKGRPELLVNSASQLRVR